MHCYFINFPYVIYVVLAHGEDGENCLMKCYDFLYDRKLKDNEFSFSHGRRFEFAFNFINSSTFKWNNNLNSMVFLFFLYSFFYRYKCIVGKPAGMPVTHCFHFFQLISNELTLEKISKIIFCREKKSPFIDDTDNIFSD